MDRIRVDAALSRSLRAVSSAFVAVLISLALTSCSDRVAQPAEVSGRITVSIASSLRLVFEDLASEFESLHPDAEIALNVGSSAALVEQVLQGAPTDVLALADNGLLAQVAESDLVESEPLAFATNTLAIVTKPENPFGVIGLGNLSNVDTVSLCVESAPCGKFARSVLDSAGVELQLSKINNGQDVQSTVVSVTQGDADAAIVYSTDAKAAGDQVFTVEIEPRYNVEAEYPIAVMTNSSNSVTASAFVDYVTSPAGKRTLASAGFGPA